MASESPLSLPPPRICSSSPLPRMAGAPQGRFRIMLRLCWLALASVLLCLPLLAEEDKKSTTIGSIERLDPAFDDLVGKDASLEKLADGFAWTEGPVWDKKGKFLLFSDIPNNAVMKYKDGEKVSVYLKPSGYMG